MRRIVGVEVEEVEGGRWKVEGGRWKVEGGRRKVRLSLREGSHTIWSGDDDEDIQRHVFPQPFMRGEGVRVVVWRVWPYSECQVHGWTNPSRN